MRLIHRKLLCVVFGSACLYILFSIFARRNNPSLHRNNPKSVRAVTHACPTVSLNALESTATTKWNIPLILHQIYKSYNIPREYATLIQGCRRVNPDFVHIIWTDTVAIEFIKKYYPQYLDLYSKYTSSGQSAQMSDFIRVLVLYHFGGVYIDMDVECRKPLSQHLDKFEASAILDQERPIQTRLRWIINNTAMNSAMISRKNHPFFKYLLDKFPVGLKHKNVMWRTGPFYLHDRLLEYNRQKRTQLDRVHLASPFAFSPMLDPVFLPVIDIICIGSYETFTPLRRLACLDWDRQGRKQDNIDDLIKDSILIHRFLHLVWKYDELKDRVHICSLPNIFEPLV